MCADRLAADRIIIAGLREQLAAVTDELATAKKQLASVLLLHHP